MEILQTTTYQRKVAQFPGFLHDNWGNFHSETVPSGLAAKILEILKSKPECEKITGTIKIVKPTREDPFIDSQADTTKRYFLTEAGKLRIYVPEFNERNSVEQYMRFGMIFMRELIAPETGGTLAGSLDQLEKIYGEG